ncbi:type II CAAX endopeptidase family protein [Alkalihalophilus lindianensis]|uniref:Type II CAAX endopeptidase family protein n=1 Tax=Alkalihalophilus lindianensis TaxID=1630542 RepID=A0ABU3X5S4_9BACI|nr:type II CAAX endopeptidase family protein [Alkalihalophilus lindianensis]MDV2683256.1 type II CAAX endopeptidase family protein [Alkalihalophilus lindianensis]
MRIAQTTVVGYVLAVFLLFMSFSWQPFDFWILFPVSLSILTIYAWLTTKMDISIPTTGGIILGVGSGIGLYVLFACGKWFIEVSGLPLMEQLQSLYTLVQPTTSFHYVWLFLIIIPGEEWFWRGFLVKRLLVKNTPLKAALIGTGLYALAHVFAGSILLFLAALIAGFVWACIYVKTRNLWVAILSHLVFDLFLLLLFPLL